jgi:hypothetical protein
MQHITIASDTEDIQPEWPQLGAYASHMPDEGTTRVTAGGTHAETWLQDIKGKMAFVLLKQAHQKRVLGGRAVHDCAIDDEQAIGIAVLDCVSGKMRPLLELERFFVVFMLGLLALYHLFSSCSSLQFTWLSEVCQESIARM